MLSNITKLLSTWLTVVNTQSCVLLTGGAFFVIFNPFFVQLTSFSPTYHSWIFCFLCNSDTFFYFWNDRHIFYIETIVSQTLLLKCHTMISSEWSVVMNPKVRTGFDLVTNEYSIWLEYSVKKWHNNFCMPIRIMQMTHCKL